MGVGEAMEGDGETTNWFMISGFVIFGLLLIVAAGYFIVHRRRKREAAIRRDSMAQIVGRPSAAQHQVAQYGNTEMVTALGDMEGNEIECSDSEVVYLSQDEV